MDSGIFKSLILGNSISGIFPQGRCIYALSLKKNFDGITWRMSADDLQEGCENKDKTGANGTQKKETQYIFE